MKKLFGFCLCFIFSFLLLSNVNAYRFFYSGCSKMSSSYGNIPLEKNSGRGQGEFYAQSLDSGDKVASCLDSSFSGWAIIDNLGYCYNDSGYKQEIVSNNNKLPDGCKIYKNGENIQLNDYGLNEYYFKAVDSSNKLLTSEEVHVIEKNDDKHQVETSCNVSYPDCETSKYANIYVKNEKYKFCSPNGLAYLSCGDAKDIPEIVPTLTSYAVTILKIATPLILIIISIIQLVKAITSSKEDDIKKAQNSLIKRIIAAAIVFFVVTIVQFVMLKVASDDEKGNLSSCLSCFLNGTDKCTSLYYVDSNGSQCFIK